MGLIDFFHNTQAGMFYSVLCNQIRVIGADGYSDLFNTNSIYRRIDDNLMKIDDIDFSSDFNDTHFMAPFRTHIVDEYLRVLDSYEVQTKRDFCTQIQTALQHEIVKTTRAMQEARKKHGCVNGQDILAARNWMRFSGNFVGFVPELVLKVARRILRRQPSWDYEVFNKYGYKLLTTYGFSFGVSITQIAYVLANLINSQDLVQIFVNMLPGLTQERVVAAMQGETDFNFDILPLQSDPHLRYMMLTLLAALAQQKVQDTVYDFLLAAPSTAVRRLVYLNQNFNTPPAKLTSILQADFKRFNPNITMLYWARAMLHPNCPSDFYLQLSLSNSPLLRQLGQYFLAHKTNLTKAS